MKLIVAGATGFVGTELVRQALDNPAVTSLIALARTETVCPPHENATKFTPVVCKDFINYPEDVKKKLEGADACVWYVCNRHCTSPMRMRDAVSANHPTHQRRAFSD
jgi:nucleoside-diphosphate-sugar epimerase